MKYHCIPCGSEFNVEKTNKPRCPKCMGVHDIQPVEPAKEKPGKSKNFVVPLVVVFVVVASVTLYFILPSADKSAAHKETYEELDIKEIIEEAGIEPDEVVVPYKPDEKIKKFASSAASGKSETGAAKAVFSKIMSYRSRGAWTTYHQWEPRTEPPLDAIKFFQIISKNTSPSKPYKALSYELSLFLLSCLISLDLDVNMVEIMSFKGEKFPADPGGKIGRFGIALNIGKDKPPIIFDPYSGRSENTARCNMRKLGEKEVVAQFFGFSSLGKVVIRDTKKALELNDAAIKLDPENPALRTIRALIFRAGGAPGEALAEMEKANKIRDDAVTRTNLGEFFIGMDPTGKRAEIEITSALGLMPDYSRAHALMAMVHLMRQEIEQAEAELTEAERLDPKSPLVALFWAQYHGTRAESEEAVAKAKLAVKLSDESLSSLLALAGLYRTIARFDEMRQTLDEVVKKYTYKGLASEIEQMFGYKPGEDKDVDDAGVQSKDGSSLFELKLNTNNGPAGEFGLSKDGQNPTGFGGSEKNKLKLKFE